MVPSTFDIWVMATILVRGVSSASNLSSSNSPSSEIGAHFSTAPCRSLQEIPGHDVGMVLHDGEHDLVALADMRAAIGAGHEVDGLGGVAGEDDLGVGARVDEAAHRLARLLEIGGGEVAEIMQPAMDVGVFLSVGALDGVEHRFRLLRRGAVVEIDERLAVDLLREDREIGADRIARRRRRVLRSARE